MKKFVVCGLLALAGWLAVAEAVEAGCRGSRLFGGRLFSGRLLHRGGGCSSGNCR